MTHPAFLSLTPRRRTWLDLLLLSLLCLLFFWRDLPLAGIDYHGFAAGDFGNQFYAFASYKALRLHAGQLPLWSPYALSGHPFLADIQSAVYYPPGLLTMLVTRVTGFTYSALQLEAILHFPLAAIGTYLLVHRLIASRTGAWVAAVTFTFSSYLTSYPPLQLAILETVSWLPWIFLALDHASEGLRVGVRRAVAPTIAAGLVFGIALTAGHPQSALHVAYAALAFAAFRVLPAIAGRDWRDALGKLAVLLAFLPIGAAVAAAQLIPSLEYMLLSTRAELGIEAAGGGFMPYDLIQFVFPQIAAPLGVLYVGVLALGLALFALFIAARGRQPALLPRDLAIFFGGLAAVGLLLSFGRLTPVYQLAYLVAPGWRLFRGQERLAVWVIFSLAILAGLAAAALVRGRTTAEAGQRDAARLLAKSFWVAAGLALLFAAACFIGFQAGNNGLWGFTAAAMFLSLMLAAAGGAIWSGRPLFFILVLVIDLFTVGGGQHAGSAETAQPFPPGAIFAAVRPDTSLFRAANEGPLTEHIGYGYALEVINGASPLRLTLYQRLLEEGGPLLVWRLLNVKYVFTSRQNLGAPAERLAEQTGKDGAPVYVYRLTDPAPRAWFNDRITVEPDANEQLARVLAPGFDPSAEVILSAPPDPTPDPACGGAVEWTERAPEQFALRVTATAPCVLTISEIAYPGWTASIDGAPARILTADGILSAVAVPAGSHNLVFTFRPTSVVAGALVSLAALAAAIVGLLAVRLTEMRRARTRARQHPLGSP